jgi:hypothetical protein
VVIWGKFSLKGCHMSSRDQTTKIVIATTDGKIVSIDHNEKVEAKGDSVKSYMDYAICEAGYDLKFVCSFVDDKGSSRIQYIFIKRDR